MRCYRQDLPPCAKDKRLVGEKVVYKKGHVGFTKRHDKQDVSVMATIVSPFVDSVAVDRNEREIPKPTVNLYV